MPFKNELLLVALLPASLYFLLNYIPAGGAIGTRAACLCYPWLTIYLPGFLPLLLLANPVILYIYFQDAMSRQGRVRLLAWETLAYALALLEAGSNLSTPNPDSWGPFVVFLFPVLSTLVVGYGLTGSRMGAVPPTGAQRRSPFVAAALASLLGLAGLWGMGHIYAERTGRGIELLVLGVVLVTFVLGLRVYEPLMIGAVGVLVVLWAWQVFDAHRIAARSQSAIEVRRETLS